MACWSLPDSLAQARAPIRQVAGIIGAGVLIALATLAQLAAERLITLAVFKTNLDYERELRRRALSQTEIVTRFTARRREFEAVWYGRDEPGAAEVNAWMAELERPLAR